MLLREDEHGVLAIGQASHAWISGQLARAWGNERFGSVEPYPEVTLAAEQHDVGMAAWDLTPSWNPETGLPHSFMEMPLELHLELWTEGPRRLVTQSRYAALLVSMHGWRLYERRDLDRQPPADAERIRAFLGERERFQQGLLKALQDDPASAPAACPELVERNSRLIWAWDYLSLALCLNWAPCTAHAVPTASTPVELELKSATHQHTHTLHPWPFSSPTVTLKCDGRRLGRRYDSADALARALAAARWETVAFALAEE